MTRFALVLSLSFLPAFCPEVAAQELQERATFKGRDIQINCVALSPDATMLAGGGNKNRGAELTLWDVASGKEISTLVLRQSSISALAFSADGRLLAAGGGPPSVWEVPAGKQRITLQGSPDWNTTLAFSADGTKLAAASTQRVHLWDLASGKELRIFQRLIMVDGGAMAFSKDLQTLASPNYEEIDLWDVSTGKARGVLAEHRGSVYSIGYSADGKTLYAASATCTIVRGRFRYRGEVRLWDVASGRERASFQDHLGRALAARLSPDGKILAVLDIEELGNEADLKLIEVSTGRQVVLRSAPADSFSSLAFSLDGRLFVMGTPDRKSPKLWEVVLPKGPGK
jgi:WD40 repeat protein